MAGYEFNSDLIDNRNRYKAKGIKYTFVDESEYVEPVSLHEFKQYALVDYATDDTLLNTFIRSARQQAEVYMQKSLGQRVVRFTALEIPNSYALVYDPILFLITPNVDMFNNIILKGGRNIEIEFMTDDSLVNVDIKVAIMSQALHLYQRIEDKPYSDLFIATLNKYKNYTEI